MSLFSRKAISGAFASAALASAGLAASPAQAQAPKAEIVMNIDTGEIVRKNTACVERYDSGECVVYPASMTKIVTAAVALREVERGNVSLDDRITVSRYAASVGGSGTGRVRAGYSLTLHEALGLIAKSSDNKLSRAIAEHVGGTVRNFVSMMNDFVEEQGIENTNFVNPTGWPNARHRTSPEQMAKLFSILADNETLGEYFDENPVIHRNILYRPTDGICYNRLNPVIVKTGWSRMSGATIGFVHEADDGQRYAIVLFGFERGEYGNASFMRNRRLVEIIDELSPSRAAERERLGPGHCPKNKARPS